MEVVRAEIMPPLADAMGLVHSDQRYANAAQHVLGARARQTFRRHVEQLQSPRIQRLEHLFGFLLGVPGG